MLACLRVAYPSAKVGKLRYNLSYEWLQRTYERLVVRFNVIKIEIGEHVS